jgi:rubredoxin
LSWPTLSSQCSMGTNPAKVDGNDKLHWLRRLDVARSWEFLDNRRYCRCCGKTFSGRQVQLIGGSRPFGPLRLACPTPRCAATPADWIYLHEVPLDILGTTFRLSRHVGAAI